MMKLTDRERLRQWVKEHIDDDGAVLDVPDFTRRALAHAGLGDEHQAEGGEVIRETAIDILIDRAMTRHALGMWRKSAF